MSSAVRRTVVGLLAAGVLWPPLAVAEASPATRATQWLVDRQQSNGAFFSSNEAAHETGDVVAAIVAGGANEAAVDKAISYMRSAAKSDATRGAYTGRIIAGIVAAHENPRSFGGADYVAKLKGQYDPRTGAYDAAGSLISDLQAANGINAAKERLPDQAVSYIRSAQCADGGFGSFGCPGSDVDTTAWAINVLVASGHRDDQSIERARSYLVAVQKSDGGFAFHTDQPTSSDSTGLALSAIAALGEDPRTMWKKPGGDPVRALLALQTSSGSFRANRNATSGNGMSTVNALPGLVGLAYPVTGGPKPSTQPTASPTPTSAPRSDSTPQPESAPVATSHVSSSVRAGSSRTTTSPRALAARSSKRRAPAKAKGRAAARPTPELFGFGGVIEGGGGLDKLLWGAAVLGAAGIGAGLWYLRFRFR